jgi:hypothetical protein
MLRSQNEVRQQRNIRWEPYPWRHDNHWSHGLLNRKKPAPKGGLVMSFDFNVFAHNVELFSRLVA